MDVKRRSLLAFLLCLPVAAGAQVFENATVTSGTADAGFYSTGAAWGDYDGDGDQDLYVTNWATAYMVPTNALYENQGDGTFVDVAALRGVAYAGDSDAAAWADYDNDGDLDLYVADFFRQNLLYENREGSFVEVGRARGTINVIRQGAVTSVGWGDYDNDGWSDLYLGKYYYANELYHNEADGTFRPITDLGVGDPRDTQAVTWVDYDEDGDLDLYVVNREQENTFYRNELSSGGTFSEVGAALGLDNKEIGQGAAWADYDNDGDLDVFVANVGANALYRSERSTGSDRFVDVAAAAGVRDLVAARLDRTLATLVAPVSIAATAGWADYDGDGDPDLYVATGGDRQEQRDVLFANQGNGTFRDGNSAARIPSTATAHMALAWGDADGNGAPDLYLTDGWGLGNVLYRNTTDPGRFVRVQVRGRGPQQGGVSRDAIGTQVRLLDQATGALRGYRQVLGGDHAAGLVFGAPAGPYEVEVRFPGRDLPVTRTGVNPGDAVVIEEP